MTKSTNLTNIALISLFSLLAAVCNAEQIDPASADGNVKLNRKIQCSLNDKEEVVYRWFGRAYARVPGQADTHIFNLEGMNIRQCASLKDPVRGEGYRLVSKEIMLYLDPKTNKLLDTWQNPWTNANNEVIHVANDPVNFGPGSFGKTEDGKIIPFDLQDINGTFMLNVEMPLFYTNPMAGDYQKYVGGAYHATEIFDFSGPTAELLDASKTTVYPTVAWVRIAKWLPWMEMGDRAGLLYFNAMGKKLENFDQLPEVMKTTIAKRYPEYRHAPPVDDQRRNETSWSYMKKIIDERTSKGQQEKAESN